jgi:tetratricopeptide (TPR) repeat protein
MGTYWPVRNYDFVNFDDDEYVYDNPHVKTGLTPGNVAWAFTKSHSANWHPITWISHMIDCELFGLNAGGHHLINLYIHLANTLLLFFLLKRMTAAMWRSAFVAALFALHPLHVESVAWISELKDVLSTFFLFLAIWAYSGYARRPRPASYLRVVFWFIMGLMTKPMLVTLPFLLLVLDFWPLNRFPGPASFPAGPRTAAIKTWWIAFRPLLIEKLPLIALSIASCVVTMIAQKKAMSQISLLVRMTNAAISYVQYVVSTIAPFHLSVFYPYPQKIPIQSGILAATMLALISVAVFWRIRKFPWLFAGWLWYLGTLVPAIGIIQVGGQARADRYTYLPLIGLCIMMTWGADYLLKKTRSSKIVSFALAFCCIASCAVCARKQLYSWQNSPTLFQNALSVTKNNFVAHNSLGAALFNKGNAGGATRHFQESMRIMPNNLAAYNLGMVSDKNNELKKAIVYFNESIRLDSTFPRAYLGLGQTYKLSGNDSLALMQYKKAILLDPDSWEAYHSLGIVAFTNNSLDKAISYFLRELEIYPQSWDAYNYLGLAWSKKGDFQRSFYYLSKGIHVCRDSSWEPYFNLGMILLKKGKLNSAKGLFSRAAGLSPKQTLPYVNRAAIHVIQGNLDSAIADYSGALSLEPAMAFAHYHLGLVFEQKGLRDSSEAHFKRAHAIDPKNVAYGIKAAKTAGNKRKI